MCTHGNIVHNLCDSGCFVLFSSSEAAGCLTCPVSMMIVCFVLLATLAGEGFNRSTAVLFKLRKDRRGAAWYATQCSSFTWVSRSVTKRSVEDPWGPPVKHSLTVRDGCAADFGNSSILHSSRLQQAIFSICGAVFRHQSVARV